MDRYYIKAEEMAQSQIAIIDRQLKEGKISQYEYDERLKSIKANIPRQAADLAWTRHEMSEALKRQLGEPTGGQSVGMALPDPGNAGGFYRPYGQAGGNAGGNLPVGGGAQRGYGPGSMSQGQGMGY